MKLTRAAETLEKLGNRLTMKHEDFDDGGVDTLICAGKNQWQVAVKCSMMGYGMFIDNWLLDLGDYIGFVQLYEHSRGGHTDPSITIVDYTGAVHCTIPRYAGDFETAAFDDNKLWLRHTDAREYRAAGLPNFTGTCIMQIDLQSGSVEREIPVQVPQEYIAAQQLAQAWLTNVGLSALRVTFTEVEAGVALDVSVVNYQRAEGREYQSLQIPLRDFLSTIS
ncbi:MAG: hypothetical protein U1F40_01960 [Turneriella sp.]